MLYFLTLILSASPIAMHFYACLRLIGLIAIKEVRSYGKIVYIKNIFENGWWMNAYPSSYPPGSVPGHKLQKPSKKFGIFQSFIHCHFIPAICKKQMRKREILQKRVQSLVIIIYLFYHNAQESTGRKQRKNHYSVI